MPTDVPAQRIWEAALGRLQLAVPRPSFDTWLRDTEGLALGENTLAVRVPTAFTAAWLEQRLHGLIEDTVSTVAREQVSVSFHVHGAEKSIAASATTATVSPPGNQETRPTIASGPPTGARFNERYTFDSFVVGPANQLAYAAASAIAELPGRSYNPLFLYSGVGLGKTHLLHAIGQRSTALGYRAAYVTTEQFTNEYLAAIRERRTEDFRDRYRGLDILLIDDIQFLSGKEGTQEGFFHTFNALRDAGKHVVITCDRLPSALPLLDERLRSRMEWGLMADIGVPDIETRTAILQSFASQAPVPVPTEVIDFLAQRAPSNIRNLEGCLNRITALAHFTQQEVTIDLAINALGAVASHQAGPTSPKAAIDAVASYFNLPVAALLGNRRDRKTANARQAAMYLLRQIFHLSPEEIGQSLGNRDRTTVIYSLKQVAKRMEQDQELSNALAQLTASLTAGLTGNTPL